MFKFKNISSLFLQDIYKYATENPTNYCCLESRAWPAWELLRHPKAGNTRWKAEDRLSGTCKRLWATAGTWELLQTLLLCVLNWEQAWKELSAKGIYGVCWTGQNQKILTFASVRLQGYRPIEKGHCSYVLKLLEMYGHRLNYLKSTHTFSVCIYSFPFTSLFYQSQIRWLRRWYSKLLQPLNSQKKSQCLVKTSSSLTSDF